MKYPREVYLIFPYDENGKIAGVYAGSSHRVEERIRGHLNSKEPSGKQPYFHALMIKNGFAYGVVDVISDIYENHIEYDWANYFSENFKMSVFNANGLKNANWRRLDSPKEKLNRRTFKFVSSRI